MLKKLLAFSLIGVLTLSTVSFAFAEETKAEAETEAAEEEVDELDEFFNSLAAEIDSLIETLPKDENGEVDFDAALGSLFGAPTLTEYLENLDPEEVQKNIEGFFEDLKNLPEEIDELITSLLEDEDSPLVAILNSLEAQGGKVADLVATLKKEDGTFDAEAVAAAIEALGEAEEGQPITINDVEVDYQELEDALTAAVEEVGAALEAAEAEEAAEEAPAEEAAAEEATEEAPAA
jgi:hypothetical protein